MSPEDEGRSPLSISALHGGASRRRHAVSTTRIDVVQNQSQSLARSRNGVESNSVEGIMRDPNRRSSAESLNNNVRFVSNTVSTEIEPEPFPTSAQQPRIAQQPKFETGPWNHSRAAPKVAIPSGAPPSADSASSNRPKKIKRCCDSVLHRLLLIVTCGMGPKCGGPTTNDRNKRALENMLRIYQSDLWTSLRVFGAFVLIFGPAIQTLFDKRADPYFLGLFIVVLVLLIADMFICACVHPNYFLWKMPCLPASMASRRNWCCAKNLWQSGLLPFAGLNTATISESSGHESRSCQFGSFMFWLDLISTLSFFPEVFDNGLEDPAIDLIRLNAAGLPEAHQGLVYEFMYVDSVNVFYIIGRTARLARFIRPDIAVKISSYFSLYSLSMMFQDWWTILSEGHWINWIVFKCCLADFCCFRGRCESAWQRDEAARVIQHAYRRYLYGGAGIPAHQPESKNYRKKRSYGSAVGVRSSLMNLSRIPSTLAEKEGSGARNTHQHRKRLTKYNKRSQVGAAMRELTAQRIALIIMVALFVTVAFTYREADISTSVTTVMLHVQTIGLASMTNSTNLDRMIDLALESARMVQPTMYKYDFANGTSVLWDVPPYNLQNLRASETLNITVTSLDGPTTSAYFIIRDYSLYQSVVLVVSEAFIVLLWVLGITGFAGPIMTLVVTPIERMIRLLEIITRDPLGYQTSPRFKNFVEEEYEIAKMTSWETNVLNGMETSFLMTTILQIGSLMRVGFGSAGVEIIRNNLNSSTSRSSLAFDQTGSTVSCIFLFCDIRQFTDATEALQEEVFVFTNRIAGVVHSICSAYGGSANKNIGDAFLLSWRLDDTRNSIAMESCRSLESSLHKLKEANLGSITEKLITGQGHAADRALYSVIKIRQALVHDNYFLEEMSPQAKERLLKKIADRPGPVVQIGFGLHAGEAVQGAIGTHRKIDATYLSETVDRSETLESLTKRYGVKVLMSGSFHNLLSNSTRRKCRKVDQILLDDFDEEGLSAYDLIEFGNTMELYTYDFDVQLQKVTKKPVFVRPSTPIRLASTRNIHSSHSSLAYHANANQAREDCDTMFNDQDIMSRIKRRLSHPKLFLNLRTTSKRSRSSVGSALSDFPEETDEPIPIASPQILSSPEVTSQSNEDEHDEDIHLPAGPAEFSNSVWISEEMRMMRSRYTDGMFFNTFDSGLRSYFSGNWVDAKRCFELILDRLEDGPSLYFMQMMKEHNWKPPFGFTGYGTP